MADTPEQLSLFDDFTAVLEAPVPSLRERYLEIEQQTLQLRRDELNFKIKVAEDIKAFLYKVLEEAQKD